MRIQFLHNGHAGLYLVTLHFLTNHEADAFAVVVAKHSLKVLRLVVFTTEAYHQHTADIWVHNHVAQYLPRVFVVVAQLRTAVGVRKISKPLSGSPRGGEKSSTRAFHYLPADAVDTADCGDNPDVITYAHLPVGTNVTKEVSFFLFFSFLSLLFFSFLFSL